MPDELRNRRCIQVLDVYNTGDANRCQRAHVGAASARAAETLQFLVPLAGEVSTEDQIDDLYDELSVLAKQGNEAEYKNRLVALNSLQAEQAARSAAVFDQWRPLAGDELDRHLADARKLLGR